jgi:hypothetical protein
VGGDWVLPDPSVAGVPPDRLWLEIGGGGDLLFPGVGGSELFLSAEPE